MSVDVAAIRKAPVGRVATLSADLFNGPDPVPGIEVELPLEQVKAGTIGADVALVPPADLAALCDEVDALRAALAAKDAENERLREALKSAFDTFGDILDRIADVPASEWPFDPEQEPAAARRLVDAADDVDILALDALDALRAALVDGEATG